jgi:hypothetical protein
LSRKLTGGYDISPIDEESGSYKAGGWVAFAAVVIIPGGAEEEIGSAALEKTLDLSIHAAERAAERGFSEAMIKVVIRRGERFFDPANGSINYVIRRGFASGKDALVAVAPFSRRVKTVISGSKLVRKRFIRF